MTEQQYPKPPIAEPVGLFKAGKSGAGGQLEPMTRIRRDIFQRVDMKYGLKLTGAYKNIGPQSMIVDIIYDGYCEHDPHSSRPMSFVADDPAQQDRGTWFGTFKAPNAGEKYSKIGEHIVVIQVAPRQPPVTTSHITIVVPKDGQTKIVTTTSTKEVPIYGKDCSGKVIITGYTEEVTTSEMEVPAETEITYEGYSVTQELGPRDFSQEAGGQIGIFPFVIFPTSEPPYDLPPNED